MYHDAIQSFRTLWKGKKFQDEKLPTMELGHLDPKGDYIDEINNGNKIDEELFQGDIYLNDAAIDPRQPTLMPIDKDYGETLGSPFVSFIDGLMLNKLYGCDNTETVSFQSPKNTEIEVELVSFSGPIALEGCPYAGIEIKTNENQQLTGYRLIVIDDKNKDMAVGPSESAVFTVLRLRAKSVYKMACGDCTTQFLLPKRSATSD
uniref:Peptidase M12A domain containing protein n=1 Tax=Haemonchus contortus TaxID=6289 RepID=W6NCW3_HAECO